MIMDRKFFWHEPLFDAKAKILDAQIFQEKYL